MPNINLVNRILNLGDGATPTERFVLKLAASLIMQIDDPLQPADERLALTDNEPDWLPHVWEYYNGMLRPKRWAIPEWIALAERERQEIEAIVEETGLSKSEATTEYMRRRRR